MTLYIVTEDNWNDPVFWSGINETVAGQTLDFAQLPSNYDVTFSATGTTTTITDGATSYTIGEPGVGGTDANLGGTTDWAYFTLLLTSLGGDTLTGSTGDDTLEGAEGADSLSGGTGDDVISGDTATGSNADRIGDDFTDGWSGNATRDSTRALFLSDGTTETASKTTPTGMGSGPGAGGGAQVSFDLIWSDGTPSGSSGFSTMSVVYNGVTYAQITTPNNDGATASISYLNGASGTPATVSEGNAIVGTGANTITIDLPPGIADSGTLLFSADMTTGTDDFALDNVIVTRDAPADGSGADTLDGGAGNDVIDGGAGADSILGGTGNDTIDGNAGADTIDGGDGNDVIRGDVAGPVTVDYIVDGGFETDVAAGVSVYYGSSWSAWQIGNLMESAGTGFAGVTPGTGGGSHYIEVDSDTNATLDAIWQDVTTNIGEALTFSFEAQQRSPGAGEHIEVVFNGAVIDTLLPADTWTTYTYDLTATGSDRVEFREVTGENNAFGPFLDNVSLTAEVTLTGEGDDSLSGGIGDDSIDGGGGADVFEGGTGNDLIFGGTGDDSIAGGDGNDVLFTGEGTDTIDGGIGDDAIFNGAGDDDLSGGAGSDSIYASAGNDTVSGDAGDDTLQGGADNDTIFGGADADLVYGDAFALSINETTTDGVASVSSFSDMPTTTVSYEITFASTTPGATNTPLLSYAVTGSDNELLFDIDGTTLRLFANDVGSATLDVSAFNVFDGAVRAVGFTWDSATGAVDFYIDGSLAGSSSTATGALTTGGTFALGQDQDSVGGGFVSTEIFSGQIYQAALWGDIRTPAEFAADATTVGADGSDPNLVANWVPDPDAGRMTDTQGTNHLTLTGDAAIVDIFDGTEVIDGGTGADTIFGGQNSDEFDLTDGYGADTIFGGEDADTLDRDRLDASALTSGVTVNRTTLERGTISDGTDTANFFEIESFQLTDQDDAFTAFGNQDLTVDAGAGDDTIQEGSGTNTLLGGTGSDDFIVGYGTADITGGENLGDRDTLDFSVADDTATVTFSGAEQGSYTDDDGDSGSFSQIEAVVGTTGADVINAAADVSTGLYLDGAGENDTLSGGSGNDEILGGSGNDTLTANAGNDTLDGGTGDDTLTGGGGDDTFLYAVGDGVDVITDFAAGQSGTITDGNGANNNFIDLSAFYDTLFELWADEADNGVLDQSNALDTKGAAVNYTDNSQFSGGGIDFTGAAANNTFYTVENTGVVCFAAGTRVVTPQGLVPIERLRPGDLVQTRDNGIKPILWVGGRTLGPSELDQSPHLRPVRLSAQHFGLEQDLIVSPQHGVVLRDPDRGGGEVLYRATHLARLRGGAARIMRGCRQISYHHILFEDHQVIFAGGLPSESLYPGPQALGAMSPAARREVLRLFPELGTRAPHQVYGGAARSYSRWGALPDQIGCVGALGF